MRRKNDLYPTEEKLTQVFLDSYPISGSVLEPCAGPGKMASVLKRHSTITAVYTNDIDPQFDCNFLENAADPASVLWGDQMFDWVITNPPFSLAPQILPLAMENCNIGVAFLLRLTYMEPTKDRRHFLQKYHDNQVWQGVVNPRPRFRSGEMNPKTGKPYGTDSVTVAWFVWRKDWSWNKLGIEPPFAFLPNWKKETAQCFKD